MLYKKLIRRKFQTSISNFGSDSKSPAPPEANRLSVVACICVKQSSPWSNRVASSANKT
jgi:hypothetical protein